MTSTTTHERRAPAFVWGYNNSGALALGHSARVLSPAASWLPAGTVEVQGGGEFTLARTEAGAIFACGGNRFGQLGDGTTARRLRWDRVNLPHRAKATMLAAGTDHALALTTRGEVYAWGRNHRGQVGTGHLEDVLQPRKVIDGGAVSLGAGTAPRPR